MLGGKLTLHYWGIIYVCWVERGSEPEPFPVPYARPFGTWGCNCEVEMGTIHTSQLPMGWSAQEIQHFLALEEAKCPVKPVL